MWGWNPKLSSKLVEGETGEEGGGWGQVAAGGGEQWLSAFQPFQWGMVTSSDGGNLPLL